MTWDFSLKLDRCGECDFELSQMQNQTFAVARARCKEPLHRETCSEGYPIELLSQWAGSSDRKLHRDVPWDTSFDLR